MDRNIYRNNIVNRKEQSERLEPSLEQWDVLYKAADEIKQMRPWEKLWDTDIFTLQMPGKEPTFLSVMGRNRECFGISIYPGYQSMSGFDRMMSAPRGEPPFVTFSYQNCLLCYFGSREELSKNDLRIIKLLGLKYRGKDQWTYFRTMRTGYCPWQPDEQEAELLTTALQQFIDAYRAMEEEKILVDFKRQTLLHRYSPENNCWETVPCDKLPVYKNAEPVIVKDELLVARLKRMKLTQTVLSLDVIFIPYAVKKKSKGVPFYPKVLLLLDETNGKILCQHLFGIDETEEELIPDMLREHILKNGRPYTLYVRDDRIGNIVEDFCKKIGVRLVQNIGLPNMDDVAESIVEYMAEI